MARARCVAAYLFASGVAYNGMHTIYGVFSLSCSSSARVWRRSISGMQTTLRQKEKGVPLARGTRMRARARACAARLQNISSMARMAASNSRAGWRERRMAWKMKTSAWRGGVRAVKSRCFNGVSSISTSGGAEKSRKFGGGLMTGCDVTCTSHIEEENVTFG